MPLGGWSARRRRSVSVAPRFTPSPQVSLVAFPFWSYRTGGTPPSAHRRMRTIRMIPRYACAAIWCAQSLWNCVHTPCVQLDAWYLGHVKRKRQCGLSGWFGTPILQQHHEGEAFLRVLNNGDDPRRERFWCSDPIEPLGMNQVYLQLSAITAVCHTVVSKHQQAEVCLVFCSPFRVYCLL